MFGKVLKNEIRHSARYNLVIYLVALAVSGLMGLSLITGSTGIGIISCVALYAVGIITVVVTLISVIKNFYDTLFSRQGYLTLTLPVKGSTLLLSKVLVSFLWIIVGLAIMASTLLLIFLFVRQRSAEEIDIIKALIKDMGFLELLPSGAVVFEVLVVLSLLGISKMLTYVGYIYFSVAVANTKELQSHPKFFGVLTCLVIIGVTSRISDFLTAKAPLTFFVTAEKAYFAFEPMGSVYGALLSYGVGGTLFSALVAFGLLVLTGYIIENKVNLK